MKETRTQQVQQLLVMAKSLLAQAEDEIGRHPNAQALSRTVSYSRSMLNVAMSCLETGGIPGDDSGRYYTPLDVMEENERLQTLVLQAALEQQAA